MYDVIIIGAGPAGANAALEVDMHGLSVLMIDEQRSAGGQVWRDKSPAIIKAPETDTSLKGDDLRERVRNSNVDVKYGSRVWLFEKCEDCWNVHIENEVLFSKSLILATGAQERVIPIPGWTLPGVMGLAGATALFKEHMMVLGKTTVVTGSGPLLFYVASEIERLGGKVAAIVSLNTRRDWIKALPAMCTQPKLLWQGFKWVLSLETRRVPIYWGYSSTEIIGDDQVTGVSIQRVDDNWKPFGPNKNIDADSICCGQGLMPAVEATRLAGADHHFDDTLGGWVPTIDEMGRTSVDGLYVCGDNAGILGALAAPHRGKNAAQAIINTGIRYDIGNVERFGKAMTALSIPRAGLLELIKNDVEVCRCEGITRDEIEQEIKCGGQSPNAIKSGTRAGMGPCGGRFCSEAQAMINQELTGKSREEIGLPTARPPLRPMPIDEITCDLNYDDLPIPGVSPL
ncbi:MAG: FAD/NAD(P)-binding oxidoreductase [Emcibacteraceae bacterium]|nr:FAD/NAD(P)-binding oxidoreductase [Emcibacteraceae bacterium]